MSKKDIATMKRIFDAVEKRRYSAMVDYYHPQIEIYEPASLPYGGSYMGYPGAAKHAAAWTIPGIRYSSQRMIADSHLSF